MSLNEHNIRDHGDINSEEKLYLLETRDPFTINYNSKAHNNGFSCISR